jgi:signal transduction histidine kinase
MKTTKLETLNYIISNLPEGLILLDPHYKIVFTNHIAEQTLNLSSTNIAPSTLQKSLKLLNKNKKQISTEFKVISKNKSESIYSATSILTQDNHILIIIRDVSHSKKQIELRENFLRTVSHELRSPLTSILGFMELLIRGTAGKLSPPQKKYLKIALKSANNLKNLINDLLDLSHIKAGSLTLAHTKVNIKKLLDNLIKSLSPLTKIKNLVLSTNFQNETLSIHTDSEKLRRILLNLVSNAIKFTEKGSILISCQEKETHLEFSIQDTGIGLPENAQEIIFEKFTQLDSSPERKYEGIGLGLSIVKELVEILKGQIWVKSAYKQGTTFTFTIPK